MVIHSIGKSRESLTHTSEEYKSLIRKYLDTMGYTQLTDSFVEGHMPDMIFINPNTSIKQELYVESKATTISLTNENFAIEILKYLITWSKQNKETRFKLFVFTKKIDKKKDFEKVYGNTSKPKEILSYFKKYNKKLREDFKEISDKIDSKEILAFFYQIEIFEANESELTNAIIEKSRHSNLSLEGYAKNLLKESMRQKKPIKAKNDLITNLVHFEPPKKYFSVLTKYRTSSTIYQKFNKEGIDLPPFIINPDNCILSTFVDITENNPLTSIFKEKPIEKIFSEELPIQFRTNLINQHLKRIFWKKGLRRIPETNIYFFECKRINDKFEKRICISGKNKEKEVSVPLYKKDNPEELNFIFHHAVELSAKYYWDKYYIEIIPRREYTRDGTNPLEGDIKSAIDKTFRNPLFNRSSNKLSEIRFWTNYLFKSEHFEITPEIWFKEFKFGELKAIDFDWTPQTYDKSQSQLGEF